MRRTSGKSLAGYGQSRAEIDDQQRARKIGSKHQINWPEILPLTSTPKVITKHSDDSRNGDWNRATKNQRASPSDAMPAR